LRTSKDLPVDEWSRQNTQFQKNDATCQTNRPTIQKLQRLFPNKVIYRRENTTIPQRHVLASDVLLWGCLKERAGPNKPRTLQTSKEKM
jgi:hypothetical protein